MAGLASFLEQLMETGRVGLDSATPPGQADRAAAEPLLIALAERAAMDFPGEPPALELTTATLGAAWLYRAAQCYAFRELEPETVARDLALSPVDPDWATPSGQWSLDLCLRQLPALTRLARGRAPGDPLLRALQAAGRRFPLSSPGVGPGVDPGVDPGEAERPELWAEALGQLHGHLGLRRLYRDRVLAEPAAHPRADHDPLLAEALREALGARPELSPELAKRLAPEKGQAVA